MSELSPKAKAMLELALQPEAPRPGTQRRLEQRLALKIATGAALVGAGASVSTSATGAALAFFKTVAIVGVGTATAVVGYHVVTEEPKAQLSTVEAPFPKQGALSLRLEASGNKPPEPSAPEPSAQRAESPAGAPLESGIKGVSKQDSQTVSGVPRARVPAVASFKTAPLSEGAVAADSKRAAPALASEVLPTTQHKAAPLAGLGQASSASQGTLPQVKSPAVAASRLQAELQALRRIQRALRTGDGAGALGLLREDNARFAQGLLRQERAAARIQALCLVGQMELARAEADQFGSRWPNSPLTARVKNSCR